MASTKQRPPKAGQLNRSIEEFDQLAECFDRVLDDYASNEDRNGEYNRLAVVAAMSLQISIDRGSTYCDRIKGWRILPAAHPEMQDILCRAAWDVVMLGTARSLPHRIPPQVEYHKIRRNDKGIMTADGRGLPGHRKLRDAAVVCRLIANDIRNQIHPLQTEGDGGGDRSDSMAMVELARRLTGRSNARTRDSDVQLKFAKYDLRHVSGHKWTLRIDGMARSMQQKLKNR